MSTAKLIANHSYDLGHRAIAAGDTLLTFEGASAADLHWFRRTLGWSAFRVVVEEDQAVAPVASEASDAPADGDKPAKGKRKA